MPAYTTKLLHNILTEKFTPVRRITITRPVQSVRLCARGVRTQHQKPKSGTEVATSHPEPNGGAQIKAGRNAVEGSARKTRFLSDNPRVAEKQTLVSRKKSKLAEKALHHQELLKLETARVAALNETSKNISSMQDLQEVMYILCMLTTSTLPREMNYDGSKVEPASVHRSGSAARQDRVTKSESNASRSNERPLKG